MRVYGFKEQIIVNDLDSMRLRIEDLGANPDYTRALNLVEAAMEAIKAGSIDQHQKQLKERYGVEEEW